MSVLTGRVGIDTSYWVNQPPHEGALLSLGSVDRFGIYVEAEGGDAVPVGLDQTCVYAAAIQPRASDRNIAGLFIASNCPTGNIAVLARAQYAPGSPVRGKVVPLQVDEVDATDAVLASAVFSPRGIHAQMGTVAFSEFEFSVNGVCTVRAAATGLRVGNLELFERDGAFWKRNLLTAVETRLA